MRRLSSWIRRGHPGGLLRRQFTGLKNPVRGSICRAWRGTGRGFLGRMFTWFEGRTIGGTWCWSSSGPARWFICRLNIEKGNEQIQMLAKKKKAHKHDVVVMDKAKDVIQSKP